MTHFLRHEQCKQCSKLGKDNAENNLGIWSDGSSFCFSCGWSSRGNEILRFKSKKDFNEQSMENKEATVFLPPDCTTEYPKRALAWIFQYELTQNDLLLNNALWSGSIERLIFPIYDNCGSVLAWQGRSFSSNTERKEPKWFGRGNLRDVLNILGRDSSPPQDRLIITEDIISAIKVAKCGVIAMPLYGSFIGRERFKRLYSLYGDSVGIYIWMDPDKRLEALKESKLGQLCGLHTHPIFSNMDPKEHSYEEIKKILI
jgi:hypothetical protein